MSIIRFLKQKEKTIDSLNEKQRLIRDKMKAARIREIAIEEYIKPFDIKSKFFEELISVSVLDSNGIKVEVNNDTIGIFDFERKILGEVTCDRKETEVFLEFFTENEKIDALKVSLSCIGKDNLNVEVDPSRQSYDSKQVRWLIRDFIYSFGKIEE